MSSRNFVIAVLGLLSSAIALSAIAATPVAVWDNNFNEATKGGYTLNLNGNTAVMDSANTVTNALKVTGDKGIFFSRTANGNWMTVLVRYSGLDRASSYAQVLFMAHNTNTSSYPDLVGLCLKPNNGKVDGVWVQKVWGNEGYNIPDLSTTLVYQFNKENGNGSSLYSLNKNDVDATVTEVYKRTDLTFSKTSYDGFSIGGLIDMSETATNNVKPAMGLTITAVAVFEESLSETDMASYKFPSEEPDPAPEWDGSEPIDPNTGKYDSQSGLIISNATVTAIEGLGLAIDFFLEDSQVTAEMADYGVEVAAISDANKVIAESLSGATNCVKGSHRIYWDIKADNYTYDASTTQITVRFWKKLYCIIDLSSGKASDKYPVSYRVSPPTKGFNVDEYKTTKLVLKRVEAGTFIMGSNTTIEAHKVTITKPFYMGLFEVTQKQWELVTGDNPITNSDYYTGGLTAKVDNGAVIGFTYSDIRGATNGIQWPTNTTVDGDSFIGIVQKRTGLSLDLPTDAQWEYACRAGTKTLFYWGDEKDTSYLVCSDEMAAKKLLTVGTKKPNQWGFYDMSGNVGEYVADRYCAEDSLPFGEDPKGVTTGDFWTIRNSGWYSYAEDSISARRVSSEYNAKFLSTGLRLSMPMPTTEDDSSSSTTPAVDPIPELDASATASDVAEALEGSADSRLIRKIVTKARYDEYRKWAQARAGDKYEDRQTKVKNAPYAYFGYALDLQDVPTAFPSANDLMMTAITPATSASENGWTIAAALTDKTIGSGATSENLLEFFEVVGRTRESDEWSAECVTTTCTGGKDGKAILVATPKDENVKLLYLRVRLTCE